MKKWVLILSMLLCTLVIAGPMAGTALAGSNYHVEGDGVGAFWSLYDEASGIHTDVNVYAEVNSIQQPPGNSQEMGYIMIEAYVYGPSTEIQVFCMGELPADSLVVDSKLSLASLSVTDLSGYMVDFINGTEDEINLDVSVEWTGTGPLIRNNDNNHFHSPDANMNMHQSVKTRLAVAEGTISSGENIIELGPSLDASIFSGKGGYVEVSK